MIKKIREQLHKLSSGGILNSAELVLLFTRMRQALDQMVDKEWADFRTLRMYCNWLVHVELGRGAAVEIIEEISIILGNFLLDQDPRYRKI